MASNGIASPMYERCLRLFVTPQGSSPIPYCRPKPGPGADLYRDVGGDERKWRVRKIPISALGLIPTEMGVTVTLRYLP